MGFGLVCARAGASRLLQGCVGRPGPPWMGCWLQQLDPPCLLEAVSSQLSRRSPPGWGPGVQAQPVPSLPRMSWGKLPRVPATLLPGDCSLLCFNTFSWLLRGASLTFPTSLAMAG